MAGVVPDAWHLDGVVADSSLAVMWRATVIADRDRSGARRLCDTEYEGYEGFSVHLIPAARINA